MGFLHHKNDVGPIDLFGGQQNARAGREAGRIRLHLGPRRKHLLSGRAAQTVGTADEEDVGQCSIAGDWRVRAFFCLAPSRRYRNRRFLGNVLAWPTSFPPSFG